MGALTLTINGEPRSVDGPSDESLLSVLRNRLDLTGTKYGCGEGQCGACTVLLDGRAVRSCQTPVSQAVGRKITTVEGLSSGDRLHPVQASFLAVEAFQCGFCTPGMIVASVALLASNPSPRREDIIRQLSGNICRCGTYPRILEAVERVAAEGTAGGKKKA